jgi:hypothetical protein
MDFFDFLKKRGANPSASDELIYEFIANELSSGLVRQGLWTKALADASWDESIAKTNYVRMRFDQIHENLLQENAKATSDQAIKEMELNAEEIAYLGNPIKAYHYLKKYGRTEDELAQACGRKKLTSVMRAGVLWVSDKPFK